MNNYEEGLCSICCLGYKHAKFLEDNIRAIWEGDYKQVEIIAIDDGSKDGSIELLYAMASQSPCNMTVIDQEHTGNIGKNFNIALSKAKGEFVSFIAMDDYLYPNALSKKIDLMKDNKKIAFISNASISVINTYGKYIERLAIFNVKKIKTISDLLELEYQTGSFFIQGCVIRTELVNKIGGFDEDMTGDDIVFRTKLFLYISQNEDLTFLIFKEPACYYRMHDSNIHKNIKRLIRIISDYLEKYWPNRDLPVNYVRWAKDMISLYPYEEYIIELNYNSVSKRLLLMPKIKKMIKSYVRFPIKMKIARLIMRLRRSNKLKWIRWIYRKIKYGNFCIINI
ncbi:MAG: glycosyltransferase [Endomicrobium sp.]|jgi:alpha-1,3-rhamnosyltransferase|nr:glycosyltransferase [Endomicrobium sp.]